MNIDDAVLAHARWKIRLTAYANKPDGSIDPVQLGTDNKCELGQWIYGEGAQHDTLPEFNTLRDAHAKFHRCAAEAVKTLDANPATPTEQILGLQSNFGKASSAVITAIKGLAQKISAPTSA